MIVFDFIYILFYIYIQKYIYITTSPEESEKSGITFLCL